jgi:hypothetical protein
VVRCPAAGTSFPGPLLPPQPRGGTAICQVGTTSIACKKMNRSVELQLRKRGIPLHSSASYINNPMTLNSLAGSSKSIDGLQANKDWDATIAITSWVTVSALIILEWMIGGIVLGTVNLSHECGCLST